MQLNGGKIKETPVSLLLSSRAEMQKVIEKARQASSSAFAITKMSTQTPSAASIASQFAKKLPEATVIVPPQPPVISLSSFLTQSMQQQAPPQVSVTQPQQLNLMSAYQTAMAPNDMSGLGGLTSLPPVGLPAQNAAAAAAYYAALMGSNAMGYANPIAAGLNVKSPVENVKASNYLSDPRSHRSNSRERNRYRSRSPDRRSHRSRSSSRDRYPSDSDGKDSSRRRTRFSAAQDRVEIPNHSALPPVISSSSSKSFSIPPPSNNVWEHPPPQVFAHEVNTQQSNLNAYSFNYNNNASAMPPRNNYKTENSSNVTSGSLGNIGTCVKVSNVDSETFYSDLRKFFAGLPIGQNDIKFVTDAKGNRTGAVLIRFVSSDSKKKALTKSMWQLKSTQVVITSISEEDFESGIVKSTNRGNQGNSYRNDDRFDSRNDRYRDRSDSRERDYPKRERFDGNRGGNNRFDDRPQNNRDSFKQRDQNDRNPPKNFRNDEQEKPKEYEPDENFSVLIIDDIPRTANEPDICEAFPNIVSIVIDRYKAYVKFTSHEAAKVTLENRYIHYIRNKRVFLEAGSEAQFNDLARKNGKFDNAENKEANNDSGNGSTNAFNNEMNDDSNSQDSSRNQKSFESRDPRQRNFANDRRNDFPSNGNGNGGAQNQIKTDCIIMKNMEPDTSIEEVENFFKDLGIYKMRVHILLDKRGRWQIFFKSLVFMFSFLRSTMWRLLRRI